MLNSSGSIDSTFISSNIISVPVSKTTPVSSVQILNPKTMWESKIEQLSSTMREMWSSEHWLQELVQCSFCNKISSKKDIFWHLPQTIYDLSVWDIMKIYAMDSISCPCCKNDTRFIYGNEHTQAVRKRLLESIHTFLWMTEEYTRVKFKQYLNHFQQQPEKNEYSLKGVFVLLEYVHFHK